MSGKSKRRGRHLSRSQRKKIGHDVTPVRSTPTPATPAAATMPVAAKAAPPPQAVTPAPETKAARALAPVSDVAGELKRIGLVGGITVLLMVTAVFVVPLIMP